MNEIYCSTSNTQDHYHLHDNNFSSGQHTTWKWQSPLQSAPIVPHSNSLVMAGELRPNLSIIFWAGMLSTRTQCGQANWVIWVMIGRKKVKAFSFGNLTKYSRKKYVSLWQIGKKKKKADKKRPLYVFIILAPNFFMN